MKTRGLIDIAELTTAEIDAMMEVAQDIVDAMHEVGIREDDLDLVHHDFWKDDNGDDGESYGVAYNNLLALLIHEVQKLKKEMATLKAS